MWIGRAAAGLQAIGRNAFTLFSCLKGLKSVLTHFILSRRGTSRYFLRASDSDPTEITERV